jgi:dihydrodiol dehydrogenase / D-xylose 1-dehydrogenase (NADP)
MSATIRWGILSTGSIANAFARALQAAPGARLGAVGSRTQAGADTFADEHNVPRRHGSYQALAADPEVDVVYVASPHPWHAEHALMCLERGKAVLCEKAFTINAREAETVIAAARRNKRFLMEAMMTRHLPIYHRVRAWVNEGRIGAVRLIECDRCINIPWNPDGRHFNLELGGSALLDVGIYPLSFAASILGANPEQVRSVAEIGPAGADEQAAVLLKYRGGAIANLNFALRTAKPAQVNVYGTDGYLEIHEPAWKPTSATLHTTDGEPETVELPMENNGLNYEAVEVMRCMREGLAESPVMPLDETLAIMRIMDGLRAEWGIRYPSEG